LSDNPFRKATKQTARLRMALVGPAGSGKTYTALVLGTALGRRVAVVDTEQGSASKYADLFAFDVLELTSFHPLRYVEALQAAEAAGYDVVILDSLSHGWVGKEGGLELHDRAVDRQKVKNTYTAWADVTPHHNAMVEAVVRSRCHVLATMRSKTDYVQEKDDSGRTRVRKVGMAPVQRDGLEYEFDVVGDLDADNTLVITKTRCPALQGGVYKKPGAALAALLRAWLAGPAAPAGPQTANANGLPVAHDPPPGGYGMGKLPPANGPDLADRLAVWEKALVDAGVCQAGDMLGLVKNAGSVLGRPADMASWDAAGAAAGWQAAAEFDRDAWHRAVNQARLDAGRQWPEVMRGLKLPPDTRPDALTRAQRQEALRLLRQEAPAGQGK
jgi:hypothetical protein